MIRLLVLLVLFSLLTACSEDSGSDNTDNNIVNTDDNLNQKSADTENTDQKSKTTSIFNYEILQKKVLHGTANLYEVKQALTDTDVGSLTNTVHALYPMRWHRGVYNLLDDLWNLNKDAHPELAWELFEKPPVRIALASTINRVKIVDADEQREYIRAHKFDDHEFHRAQVVVALGLNGDVNDLEYIKSMAMAENHYVAQSAISGLGLMGGKEAKYALAEVWREFQDTKRGELAKTLIQKIYNETPTLENPKL